MATQSLKPVRPLRRMSGGPICPTYFPEGASQTFKKGELVYLSSGYVTEYTVTTDDDSTRLLGVAAEDGHNDTTAGTSRVGVYLPDDDLIFIGSMYHSTVASSLSAVTDVGALYPFAYDTTNSRVYVDKEDNAGQEDCCRIVGLWSSESHEEAVGDYYPQVLFIIEAINRTIGQ